MTSTADAITPSQARATGIVVDNGVGIRPEVLPHVFDRFHQADRSTTRRFGGLGLGLSIVKHLMKLHGGSIRAISAGEGQGATFTITIPCSVAPLATTRESLLAPRDAYEPVSLDAIRVLVVEDEADTRDFLKRLLETNGADVAIAVSAEEALVQFRLRPPDLVISDIGLPAVDGYDLMQEIRRVPASASGAVPAIALTAYARPEDRTRALRAGYQTHLAKPVEPAELLAAIASLAGLMDARRRIID